MVRYWDKLSREVVDALSLEVFKVRLDEALSKLVKWKVSLPKAEKVELHLGLLGPLLTQTTLLFYNSISILNLDFSDSNKHNASVFLCKFFIIIFRGKMLCLSQ